MIVRMLTMCLMLVMLSVPAAQAGNDSRREPQPQCTSHGLVASRLVVETDPGWAKAPSSRRVGDTVRESQMVVTIYSDKCPGFYVIKKAEVQVRIRLNKVGCGRTTKLEVNGDVIGKFNVPEVKFRCYDDNKLYSRSFDINPTRIYPSTSKKARCIGGNYEIVKKSITKNLKGKLSTSCYY